MAAETEILQTETTEVTHAEPTGVLGTLGVSTDLLIAQFVNFAIVLLVLWRWVYRPLMKKMDQRAKTISDGLSFADESKIALAEAEQARDQMLREAKAESHVMMEKTLAEAEKLKAEKLVQAKDEIEKVIAEAKQQIKAERDASFDALKGEIAELVSLATAKVAGAVDEKTQRALIADALQDIERA
ncbi:MAG: F0F1 ATP synthase subunit B [Patescibacteria group bacterium]|jgi:F-type H+-transporting ATPase subunit b